MPLDPALKAVLDQMAADPDAPKLHMLEPAQAREFFESMQLPAPETELAKVDDIVIPGPAGKLPARVYRPKGEGTQPVLVYFHGGGWVIGSIETHDASCRELAELAGCTVVSVEYRLAPEHPYPAAPEDCYAATRWIADNADALKIDPRRIAVGGDSAGGNLTAVVALMARDKGGPALCFQLLIYPVTDADFDRASYQENATGYFLERDAMRWFWDLYVSDEAKRQDAYAAPLHAEDLSDLPPALVITAEYDPLRDEGEAYGARLEAADVPVTISRYDGMIHGFFAMGMLAQRAQDAVEEASQGLRKAFGG